MFAGGGLGLRWYVYVDVVVGRFGGRKDEVSNGFVISDDAIAASRPLIAELA